MAFLTRFRKALLAVVVVVSGVLLAVSALGATDFDKLLATLTQRWGAGPYPEVQCMAYPDHQRQQPV